MSLARNWLPMLCYGAESIGRRDLPAWAFACSMPLNSAIRMDLQGG